MLESAGLVAPHTMSPVRVRTEKIFFEFLQRAENNGLLENDFFIFLS